MQLEEFQYPSAVCLFIESVSLVPLKHEPYRHDVVRASGQAWKETLKGYWKGGEGD
jgi:hypothetical protein